MKKNKEFKDSAPKNRRKKAESDHQDSLVAYLKMKSSFFFNREFSWLQFNKRVLEQAMDRPGMVSHPLLERLRYCNIFISNLDEFFMKRIGGLKDQIASSHSFQSVDGKTPRDQIKLIREEVQNQVRALSECFENSIVPKLKENGIRILKYQDLSKEQKEFTHAYFKSNLYPILTPLAVDPGHPFPFISNLSKNFGIKLKRPDQEERLFARVKVPNEIPQWLELPTPEDLEYQFIAIDEIIRHHLSHLFRGLEIIDSTIFKVTRNADLSQDDEDAEDLLEFVESELKERKFAPVLRLEIENSKTEWIKKFLQVELELDSEDIYELPSLVCHSSFSNITNIDRPDIKFPIWKAVTPHEWQETELNVFHLIRKKDYLIHHPYESFQGTVEKFVREAARDPKVIAIKITLYRTGRSSGIVDALLRAAENGKQVACLIELKARFDEQNNIRMAQKLEKAGIHVAYGMVGLKTHSKMCIVVRDDFDGPKCYVHIGTGNYNAATAGIYTDFSYFTCNNKITSEVIEVFNYLTGISLKYDYEHLLVAPLNMRKKFTEMIRRETEFAKAGKKGLIVAKMNSLEDVEIINELYEASRAGVEIRLIVRGFCTLRPGVSGVSENIKVRSNIGRYLEHSRVFYFLNGHEKLGEGDYFIGSADWMYRNLNGRVEVITPVFPRELKEKLWHVLEQTWNDSGSGWELSNTGEYNKISNEKEKVKLHDVLMEFHRSHQGS